MDGWVWFWSFIMSIDLFLCLLHTHKHTHTHTHTVHKGRIYSPLPKTVPGIQQRLFEWMNEQTRNGPLTHDEITRFPLPGIWKSEMPGSLCRPLHWKWSKARARQLCLAVCTAWQRSKGSQSAERGERSRCREKSRDEAMWPWQHRLSGLSSQGF